MITAQAISLSPLSRALRTPSVATGFSVGEWETLLWQGRATRLSGRLWHQFSRAGVLEAVPAPVERRLRAAFVEADFHRRTLLWEVDRLHHAFYGTGISFILLKGAAYAAAGLDLAYGRPAGDIDVLVPQEAIVAAERVLVQHGWEHVIDDDYDQQYYRRWMHELPPLRHSVRETELDLHHAIVPRTSRLKPDMSLVRAAATMVDDRGTRVLAPVDMLLHCAVHLFHDGEIRDAFRDLVDLDALLRRLGRDPELLRQLVPRACQLGLQRPLFYALRYTTMILDTPIPAAMLHEAAIGAPQLPVQRIMDAVVPRALAPELTAHRPAATRLSTLLLKSRAHWLRMAPTRLALHLARKSVRRLKEA